MVATWSRRWFRNEGTRVFYLVPRALTDEILPLTIDPAPDELVRVLVGRIEFLPPAAERDAIDAIRGSRSRDEPVRLEARQRLDRFGRFLEAVARRVATIAPDPETRAAAEAEAGMSSETGRRKG